MKEWVKNDIITDIFSFFNNLNSITMLGSSGGYTSRRIMKNDDFKNKIISSLQNADFSIQNIFIEESDLPEELLLKIPELK